MIMVLMSDMVAAGVAGHAVLQISTGREIAVLQMDGSGSLPVLNHNSPWAQDATAFMTR